jgi:uncharacterized protein YyaL (SSP411 family)
LMIRALAEASRLFAHQDWLDLALASYRSISESMVDGRLPHSVLGDSRLFPGLSSDYAAMINAALSCYQATQDKAFVEDARRWLAALGRWHRTADGNYALSASDGADVIVRVRGDQDEAIPSATSQIVEAIARLAVVTGDETLRQHAQKIAENALGRVLQQRYGQAGVLNSASLVLEPMRLILVTPDKDDKLMESASRFPDPRRTDIWIEFNKNKKIELVPGAGEVTMKKPAAYLCRGLVCLAPVETAGELETQLRPVP